MRQVRGSDFPVADILVAVALELCIILVKKIPYKIRTHPDPDLSLAAPQRFKVVKRNFALFYFFAILPALLVGAVLISKNRRLKMANVLVSYFVAIVFPGKNARVFAPVCLIQGRRPSWYHPNSWLGLLPPTQQHRQNDVWDGIES